MMRMRVVLVLIAMLFFAVKTNGRPDYRQTLSPLEDTNAEQDNQRPQKLRHARQNLYYPYQTNDLLYELLQEIKVQMEVLKNSRQTHQETPPPPTPIVIILPVSQCGKQQTAPNLTYRPVDPVDLSDRFLDINKAIWGVETGTSKSNNDRTTETPIFTSSTTTSKPIAPAGREPTICETAVIYCCAQDKSLQKSCFDKYGCWDAFKTGKVCTAKVINYVIAIFKNAYGPR